MNKAPWIFGTIALLTTAAAYGCGNSTATTTTTAGTGGTSASSSHAATTGTTSTHASTGATGTGGNGAGGGTGGSGPTLMSACMSPATPPSAGSCYNGTPGGPDGGDIACNPFTGAPCNTAQGESCDFGGSDFKCYGPPNDVALCGACDDTTTFCKVGLTCLGDGKCTAFCCTDADCGTGGKCDLDPQILTVGVGICVASP